MTPHPQLAPVTSFDDGLLGEPISPELVLVDPVLAERVRALPESPPPGPASPPSGPRLGVAPSPAPSPVVERPDDSTALEPPRSVEPGVAELVSLRAPLADAILPAATESDDVAVPIEAPVVPADSPEAERRRIVAVEPPRTSEPPLIPRATIVDVVPAPSATAPARLVPPPSAAGPASLLRERIRAAPGATDAQIVRPTPAVRPPTLTPERAPEHGLPASNRPEPPAGRRRLRGGKGAALLAVGMVVGLVGGVIAADAWMRGEPTLRTVAPTTSRGGSATSADSSESAASAPSVSGSNAATSSAAPKTPAEKPSAPKAAAPKKVAPKKPTAGRSKQAQPAKRPPVAPVQSPAFVWIAVPGATRYEVVFERGGKVVYSAATRSTRLELPRSWRYDGKAYRLERGRYHWTVWPIVDGNRGKPVVSSDYTV